MNGVVAVILAKERRMVSRFVAAGATSRERARTLDQIGVSRGVILRRLRDRAVVRQTGQDLFYVDQESWEAVRRSRRRAASAIVIVGLILIFAVLWSRRAQAGDGRAAIQLSAADISKIDDVFAQWNKPSSPGCALAIYRDGKVLYERGYGMADLENDVPITPATVFYVGSVSKQFTAAAAALAIQQGSLSADDSIRQYLPELPPYADAITVRHLVHHTSGLRDYNTLLAIAGRRGDEAYDNATVLRITARQKALNFAPGTEHLYSNTGYTLLATIVERATKQPFAAFADDKIFRPLGMHETHFHTDSGRLVKRRAQAYATRQDGSVRLDTPANERAGAGGVFTSVRELLHWDENFYTGKVGGKALIDQLETPGRLMDGRELTYAWGLRVATYRTRRIVEHGGSLGGYRAHFSRFPQYHTSVAALCNVAIAPEFLVKRVADIVLAPHFQGAPTDASAAAPRNSRAGDNPAAAGEPLALSMYVGQYVSEELDATFRIAADGGRLTLQRETDAQPIPLRALQKDTFLASTLTIRFEQLDGRAVALRVDAGRVRGIRFVRTD